MRLANVFSKSLRHLPAAALHYAYGNLCRVPMSLRVTPTMQAGLMGHVWVDDLLEAVMEKENAKPRVGAGVPQRGVEMHQRQAVQ